jgi:imidazolonepropionase-like amidohydrolase
LPAEPRRESSLDRLEGTRSELSTSIDRHSGPLTKERTVSRIVLKNTSLLDGRNPTRHGIDIVVEDELISSVNPAGEAPLESGDAVVDLTGKTVMPGLVEGHLHMDYDALAEHLYVVNLGAERPLGVLMAYAIRNARTMLHAGVTSVMSAGCGLNLDVQLKMAIDEGVAEGPHLRPASGFVITTGTEQAPVPWWNDQSNQGMNIFADGPDEFRKQIRRAISRGAKTIKLALDREHGTEESRGLRNMSRDEITAAIQTAHERGALIRAHLPYKDQLIEAVSQGLDIVDHGDELDEECIEIMVKHGAALAPTPYFMLLAVRAGRVDRSRLDHFTKMLRLADEAGIRLLIGDDYGARVGPWGLDVMHAPSRYGEEVAAWVNEFGFDPVSAIRIATHNGATVGRFNSGLVEAGRLADLIVLDSDPTKNIDILAEPTKHVLGVMKAGAFYNASSLERELHMPASAVSTA